MILEKLPIFLHGLDERLKKHTMDLLQTDDSSFVVRGCEDLRVEMRLDYLTSQDEKHDVYVSAEITEDDSRFTLWLAGPTGPVEKYEYVKLVSSSLYIYNI